MKKKQQIDSMLRIVYDALNVKGYNAVAQIWDYLLTEDEKYITSYNNARTLITSFDREDIGFYILEKCFGL